MIRRLSRLILDAIGLRQASSLGDILIFTVPRSGLTWLLEMLDTLPHTRCIKEPFSPARKSSMELYFQPKRRYINPSDTELESILRYLQDIMSNKVLRMGYNFKANNVKLRTNLNIVVISKLSNLAPILADRLGCRVLYLTRHPVPNALSKLRSGWLESPAFGEVGWSQFIDVYLNSDSFCNTYLSEEQVHIAWEIRRNEEDVARFVLSWCLDNIVLLRSYREKGWPMITYEDLVVKPTEVIRYLGYTLEIDKTEKMYSRLQIPSQSTAYSSNETIEMIRNNKSREHLITKWQDDLDRSQLDLCDKILKVFDIDIYNCDSPLPNEGLSLLKSNVSNSS